MKSALPLRHVVIGPYTDSLHMCLCCLTLFALAYEWTLMSILHASSYRIKHHTHDESICNVDEVHTRLRCPRASDACGLYVVFCCGCYYGQARFHAVLLAGEEQKLGEEDMVQTK
ncbi:hypothetical protein GOP47_0011593 [Adiantum capillus-veneris]|uniref:Uncharacterized protein n=1 Tax=Adiantum capillus-veneris TaxID=13818 RepID=A0A9D4UTK9_ADICA|nr:hypothetical protein GOP47_0011593 [Adiantum capillus-veneris]